MQDSAELAGRLVAMVVLAFPSLYFLIRGLAARLRSRRLANLALFCGLTVLVAPQFFLGPSPPSGSRALLTSGAVCVLLGLGGLALAVAAIVTRRDGGVGVFRLIAAAGFSLLPTIFGAGLLMYGSFTVPSTPWVYESREGAYRLTLPSRQWKQVRTQGGAGAAAFVRPFPLPRMQARIVPVKPQQADLSATPGAARGAEADFARAAEAFRTLAESNPRQLRQLKSREGTNAGGNLYRYFTLMDSTREDKPVYLAYSVTLCQSKQIAIEVFFEALPTMTSQVGKAAEMEAIERSAETICLSVE